ncbi:hypothetical protein D9619_002026 [Psilocybe cf. subviscida]|uniref:Cytochrome P450 n=1 Tax=Psilocybe cf. subviscida TaxID=2480587 RepID=A0A8H5BG88_9AGAR|nr:hypothetical protein D9619_002026 [Psilocybe cf. subviscida]
MHFSLVALALSLVIWYIGPKLLQRGMMYPPGPKAIPVIGNLLDLTPNELWVRASSWARKFGGICYLNIFGQSLVFINDAEIAFDLLDKRGAIYSSKPPLVMVGEMCGCAEMIPFTPYGDKFKRRRRLMHETLGPRSISNYHEGLQVETIRFVQSLLADPKDYIRHIRRYSGGLTLSAVYGYNATSSDDKFLLLAEESMDLIANEIVGGVGLWPVDIFPFLRYIPAWAPGGGFKRKAAVWKSKIHEFMQLPYDEAKDNMATGTILPSFCSSHLDLGGKLTPEQDDDLKWTANSMYAASVDTTIATVSHLILAMMYFPEEFKKARQEIEKVVGTDRLPSFGDRDSLPYVECILNETWRWGCPVPLNLPHMLDKDDEYLGYYIPKGSLVIANIWNILRDERIYPEPEKFKPSRFAESGVDTKKMDPRSYVFGFGRR